MIKRGDIATIILVVFVSLVASFFISNALINKPENRSSKVEVVHKIDTEFNQPSDKIFNDSAIDPTELIQIGGDKQDKPFSNE